MVEEGGLDRGDYRCAVAVKCVLRGVRLFGRRDAGGGGSAPRSLQFVPVLARSVQRPFDRGPGPFAPHARQAVPTCVPVEQRTYDSIVSIGKTSFVILVA